MKKLWMIAASVAGFGIGVWGVAQVGAGTPPLDTLVPPSPLLYLETKNLGALLGDWNASPQKTAWLGSANYKAYSRSYLALKLSGAYDEFAAAAGIPPDMALLQSIAGGESAVALYDISKLEFLFLTRVNAARAMESALYKARNTFSPRNAAGRAYWVKRDGGGKRTAAFALVGDLLLLATREEALAGALTLLGGQAGPRMRQEQWFDDAVKAAPAAGEVRLVMNLERIVRTSHFRSYWIQRNVADMGQFRAGVTDLRRDGRQWREERVLLRKDARPAVTGEAAGELLRLVPDNAGLYRAWATADTDLVMSLVVQKVLDPRVASASAESKIAPGAAFIDAVAGSESDLETRIDQAPVTVTPGAFRAEPLRALLDGKVKAVLQVQTSRELADGVFVGTAAAIAMLGTGSWNSSAVSNAIRASLEQLRPADGLTPVIVGLQGSLLVFGTRAELVNAVLARAATPARPGTAYAAGVRFAQERRNYDRMMRFLDTGANPALVDPNAPAQDAETREPYFFSENLSSLAGVMGRLESATLVQKDNGGTVQQSVVYQLAP